MFLFERVKIVFLIATIKNDKNIIVSKTLMRLQDTKLYNQLLI